MISQKQKWILWAEIVQSWLVFLVLLYYTDLEIAEAPYIGFDFSSSSGRIIRVFVPNAEADLRANDVLVKVGDVVMDDYRRQLRATLFPEVAAGSILLLEIERAGETRTLHWPVPGFNEREFNDRIFNLWWLGYLFWMTGLATLLLVRPLDSKRSLFAAFFFLTALWLVLGNTSRWGHADSRVLYRMALILSVPVVLHLHWLFPRPLSKVPAWLLWSLYGVSITVALLQWTPVVPGNVALLVYALSLLGSLSLLFAHYIRQPETRPHVRLLLYALLFGFVPLAILTTTIALWPSRYFGTYALATLPIIPGAYFYAIYRFQLGGSEVRANRLIALYLYLIALGTTLLIASSALSVYATFDGSEVLWSTLLGLAVALLTLYLFPLFQHLVDRRLLAMPLPPVRLIETYLARITTTLNETNLGNLLKNEVLPSLLIRESALLRIRNHEASVIYTTGDELSPEVVASLIAHLRQNSVYRVTRLQELPAPSWVRLALALQVEERLIGLWLLGRHDPDDLYSPVEVATLQTLARQTALALANIEQAAQLQALYQASIERQELERMKLAHFLHDAVLNQAAHLYMSLDEATLNPRVENAYATLKEQLRQMISNLRPPSLDLGLGAALEELAVDLEQRGQIQFELRLNIPNVPAHYPVHIENHIFRIVQQACENAFRHSHAQRIQLYGTLQANRVELTVEDDGVGFHLNKPLEIAQLLAQNHFGLVHMIERAEHINAELTLESAPGEGTRVRLLWSARSEEERTGAL